jgi:hypothetical protein
MAHELPTRWLFKAAGLGPCVLSLAVCACSRSGPTTSECEALIARYVLLRNGQAISELPALNQAFVRAAQTCSRDVSHSEYACAQKSETADQWEACIQ